LTALELHDVLIGSYARATGIHPGKDVDIFAKLTAVDITEIDPEEAYTRVRDALAGAYDGRITEQPRSLKISFGSAQPPQERFLKEMAASRADVFDFAVDVVPAVRSGDRWAIPRRDREQWRLAAPEQRWVVTDPEAINALTVQRNDDFQVAGDGAFVPTVKAIKQIRRHHLGDQRPGGLFFEFILHEGFLAGEIRGDSWADVTASALAYIEARLSDAATRPVCDPALQAPFEPAPSSDEVSAATRTFTELKRRADEALEADRCAAAALWRGIFGTNDSGPPPVFPLPPGCRADGTPFVAATSANPLRGSDEARGFGVR
jgi:hypothetical protein